MTEEDFIDFRCPHCQQPNSFLSDMAGTAQACPICQETVIVPPQSCEAGGQLPLPVSQPRLVLRRLQPGDWKDLLELMSDDELFRFVPWYPLEEQDLLHWLESDQAVRITHAGQALNLGVELKGSGKLVGYLSQSFTDDTRRQVSVGVFLSRDAVSQGIGSEALHAAFEFGFRGLGLLRMTSHCDSRNAALRQMCEAAGMRREGEFLKDRFVKGEWVNTVHFATLREEYEADPRRPAGIPSA
ncbi:MAG: GNAT family N-acetyltransferase [Verrucomicrobia bacterium]|nr:GNAT family N-acetyltransferase [Verrucomicrobiota bacterium]